MKEQSYGQNYSRFVNTLIFTFPIVINSLQVVGDLVLFILAMMGIFIAISKKISPFSIKEIKVFSYLTFGYFTVVCLSVLFSGQPTELAHFIPRDFHFLFAPFIALALYKAKLNINYLIVGAKFALLVLGMIVSIQLLQGHLILHRPSGVMNAAVFGNLTVSLFFIVLIFSQNESIKHKVFTLLSLFLGFVAIIASGTRGAWLSFLLLFGVYSYLFYKQKNKLNIKLKIIIVFVIVCVISFVSLNQYMKDRMNFAYTQTIDWVSGDKSPSGVSLRLEMYTKSINNIKDVPFFGHGYRTSNIVLFQNDSSATGRTLVGFNHLHNAYLTNYYNGGIVLLSALLLLLFVPLRLFIKANSQNRENPIFISGVLLTLGYASFGMVNILLGDTYMNGFYTFFLAIFMLLHAKSIKIPST